MEADQSAIASMATYISGDRDRRPALGDEQHKAISATETAG